MRKKSTAEMIIGFIKDNKTIITVGAIGLANLVTTMKVVKNQETTHRITCDETIEKSKEKLQEYDKEIKRKKREIEERRKSRLERLQEQKQ
jgi:hypothetical protein